MVRSAGLARWLPMWQRGVVLVTATAAALIGGAATAGAQPSTPAPSTPERSTPEPSTPLPSTTPPAPTDCCTRPDPTLTPTPSTAEPGAAITLAGDYWPCGSVRISPDWSDAVLSADAADEDGDGGGAFRADVPISGTATAGSHTITVECSGEATQATEITVVRAAPFSEPPVSEPSVSAGDESIDTGGTPAGTPVSHSTSPTTRADEQRSGSHAGTIAAIAGFLLVALAAAVVRRLRRPRPEGADPAGRADPAGPRPPDVRVRVAAAGPPVVTVRERRGVPRVRVRVVHGEPRIRVAEVRR